MKISNYIKLVFLMMIFTISSCTEMLDETPLSTLTPENLFQTVADADAASSGMYAGLIQDGISGWGILYPVYGWGIMGTDIWTVAAGNRSPQSKWSRYTLTAAEGQVADNWAYLYNVINRANNILAFVGGIDASEAVINSYLADARFIRAFCYMDLVQFYGGVPLRLEPTQSIEDALGSPRRSEEDVWAQIIEDLEYAAQYLPENVAAGKASKWAAKGLLAKAYLTRGGYPVGNYQEPEWFDKAAKAAYEVISQSGISLNPTTPGSPLAHKEFGQQFTVSGENSPESLFELQYLEPDYGSGWGYRSIQFRNRWDETATGNYYGLWGGTVIGSDFALSFNDNDIRFQWSIGPFGILNGRLANPFARWMPYKHRWESIPGNAWATSVNAVVLRMADVYLLFAEAANEATGDPNNNSYGMSAYEAINVVRERAQVTLMDDAYLMKDSPYSTDEDLLYGQSFESFDKTNPNYDGRHVYYTGSLKERFASAVLMERGWELCFERHRWFDLKRTGKLIEFAQNTQIAGGGLLNAAALEEPIDKSDFQAGQFPKAGTSEYLPNAIQPHNIYVPIPDVEIQINPELNQEDQNDGY